MRLNRGNVVQRYAVCRCFTGVTWLEGKTLALYLENEHPTVGWEMEVRNNDLFRRKVYVQRLLSCSRFFASLQERAIEENIKEFTEPTMDKVSERERESARAKRERELYPQAALQIVRDKACGRFLSAIQAHLLPTAVE